MVLHIDMNLDFSNLNFTRINIDHFLRTEIFSIKGYNNIFLLLSSFIFPLLLYLLINYWKPIHCQIALSWSLQSHHPSLATVTIGQPLISLRLHSGAPPPSMCRHLSSTTPSICGHFSEKLNFSFNKVNVNTTRKD